jgi:hypothetical protein
MGKLSIFLLPIGQMFLAAIDMQWGPTTRRFPQDWVCMFNRARMEYSESVHDRNFQAGWTSKAVDWLRTHAFRQIKGFSHARDKDAILRYIGERLDMTGPSAFEIPLAVHQLIARGISHFTNASGHQ